MRKFLPFLVFCLAFTSVQLAAQHVRVNGVTSFPTGVAFANLGVLTWSPSVGAAADVGISRAGVNSLAFGNGTQGNTSATINFGTANLSAGGGLTWATRSAIGTSANKLFQIEDNSFVTGLELNMGTPTLGTCTGGAITSGAHNFGGEVTGTTGGTCAINFGAPNFTNTPFCFAIDETATGIVNTSGETTATFNITNITSGHAVKFFCVGRIGV